MADQDVLSVVERFGDALNAYDIDAVMALMTDDCLFENTSPFPDGEVFRGQDAVRAFWTELSQTPGMRFDTEETVVAGDRVTARWRYTWTNADGTEGHIRGVDLFKIRDGKVAEKLSYVKG
jgi:ketosteroid isomerase-like protein